MSKDKAAFWTDKNDLYAKRNNIFLIQFDFNSRGADDRDGKAILDDMSGIQYEAKSVTLPSFSFSQNSRSVNSVGGAQASVVPGKMDWEPVTLTFSDILYRIPAHKFSSLYESILYAFDRTMPESGVTHGATAYDPVRFRRFFNNIIITSITEDAKLIDQWTLKGPWPVGFKSPDLSYDNDGIREFSLTLDYVVAEYKSYTPTGEVKRTMFKANSQTVSDHDPTKIPKPGSGW